VRIRNRQGEDLPGVIGTKPVHIMTDEEKKKLPQLEELFVDVGLTAEEARRRIQIGNPATLTQELTQVGDYWSGKSLDNRVSIYTLVEALRRAKKPKVEIYAVATCQEEVGLRGAGTAAHRIRPDIGVAIDVTLACDVPGTKPEQHVTRLRHGVGIKILDSSFIAAPKLVEHCRLLAESHGIPHQMEILPRGGTDAGAIQRAAEAVPSITFSVPTRYLHSTVETIYGPDLEATVDLLARFLETAHEVDLTY
jgi:endoglucanase